MEFKSMKELLQEVTELTWLVAENMGIEMVNKEQEEGTLEREEPAQEKAILKRQLTQRLIQIKGKGRVAKKTEPKKVSKKGNIYEIKHVRKVQKEREKKGKERERDSNWTEKGESRIKGRRREPAQAKAILRRQLTQRLIQIKGKGRMVKKTKLEKVIKKGNIHGIRHVRKVQKDREQKGKKKERDSNWIEKGDSRIKGRRRNKKQEQKIEKYGNYIMKKETCLHRDNG